VADFLRVAIIEAMKLRRTLALKVSIIVPLALIGLTLAVNLARTSGSEFVGDHPNGWDTLMLDQTLVLWCFVLLPLFVTLEAALLAGIEHRENSWKHLYALPIPRWTIFASKLIVGFALVVISSVVLALGTVVQGWILVTFRSDFGLPPAIPWDLIVLRNFGFLPAVPFMLAIQIWVAIRWRSFTVPMAVGIAATMITIMLLRTLKSGDSTPFGPLLAAIFPWSIPYIVIAPLSQSYLPEALANLRQVAFAVGLTGGLAASFLGCWEATRRDVA